MRALIIHTNPWPLWLAVERDIVRGLGSDAVVDAVDVARLLGTLSPLVKKRDLLYNRLDQPYRRWLVPVLSGRDITGELDTNYSVPPLPETVDALRSFVVDGSRVGLAALSSAVSETKIASDGPTADYGPVLEDTWRAAWKAQRLAEQIAAMGYDRAYVFNGRFCYARPFCDVLEQLMDVYRYEQGGLPFSYILIKDQIHAMEVRARMALEHQVDRDAGVRFYEHRLVRAPGSDGARFAGDQKLGHVPPELGRGDAVTFFTSSVDEYFATQMAMNFGEFSGQSLVAVAVAQACRRHGKPFGIRLHPHLRLKHASWRREWDFDALRRENAIILAPEDPCDSYALLKACGAVITCGSTMGLEAAFHGIPAGVVGNHYSNLMGATTLLTNQREIDAFVENPTCRPGARDAAIAYGSWRTASGKSVPEFSQPAGAETATIRGRKVWPARARLGRIKKHWMPAH